MRVLERRLRRLEAGLSWQPVERPESRRILDAVRDSQRRHAARLGLPAPDKDPEPVYRPGMSFGDTLRAGLQRMRERWAAEEAGVPQRRIFRAGWNNWRLKSCRPAPRKRYS